jgi:drug/metabolite transporter (DMT)-like permease
VAYLAFAFCCVVWGSTFILLERVTHAFSPVEIGIWRMLSGAAVVGAFCLFRGSALRLSRRDWFHIAIVAVVANAPPQVIQPYLLAHGLDHGFLGTMVAGIPLLTILVSIPMLGIAPTGRELIGVLGGLVCLALILGDGMDRGLSLGLLALVALVPLTSALSNTYVKWKLNHVAAGPLTAGILALAGMSLIPLGVYGPAAHALQLSPPAAPQVSPTAVFYLFLLGVIASGMSTLAFTWMILQRGPLFAGMTTYVVPVLALAWGQLDEELISPQQVAAIVGVLAMVALVQSGTRPVAGAASVMDVIAPPQEAVAVAEPPSPACNPLNPPAPAESLAS